MLSCAMHHQPSYGPAGPGSNLSSTVLSNCNRHFNTTVLHRTPWLLPRHPRSAPVAAHPTIAPPNLQLAFMHMTPIFPLDLGRHSPLYHSLPCAGIFSRSCRSTEPYP